MEIIKTEIKTNFDRLIIYLREMKKELNVQDEMKRLSSYSPPFDD